MLVQQAEVTH